MSFNGSFGDADFANDENSNDISLGQEDIKINLSNGKDSKKTFETKCFINNDISIPTNSNNNNNIFSAVPMELEEESNYQNINIPNPNIIDNNYYIDLLSKELLKYNLGNLFNILNDKKAIIKSNIFYLMKKMYKSKLNNMIKAEILYLKISSSFNLVLKIFRSHRANIMYQVFNKIKRNYIHYKDMKENNKNNFRTKFEMNYTKEKNNLINDNNNSIKSLQRDIQILKKNINQLTTKESELKSEIFNFLQEEKQLSEKIKSIETLNSSLKKSIQTSNSSSIKTISKYDTDILSLESDLKFNKNLKEEKKEIINAFMNKVYILLNEYQAYIDNLKTLDLSASNTNTNTNNNMNNELTSSSNLQSIKQKDTMENSLIASKFSARNQSNDM
jgi:hypothetical protein